MGALFHSVVIAQILGLYMVIMAVILLSRAPFFRGLIEDLNPHSSGVFMGASFGLLFGLFLVVVHNIWVLEPRVVITIVGWLILIKSIIWLAFPEAMLRFSKKMVDGAGLYIYATIVGLVGIFLLIKGFYIPMYLL